MGETLTREKGVKPMDSPTESNEKAIRCSKCFKLLYKEDKDGVAEIRFQRLAVRVAGNFESFTCPRCEHVNVPPFYTKAVAPTPTPPADAWPARPVLPPLKPPAPPHSRS